MESKGNENTSDKFEFNQMFGTPSITSENLHFNIENCILDIQNLDNIISAIKNQLESRFPRELNYFSKSSWN